jgi:hypothetical protein
MQKLAAVFSGGLDLARLAGRASQWVEWRTLGPDLVGDGGGEGF